MIGLGSTLHADFSADRLLRLRNAGFRHAAELYLETGIMADIDIRHEDCARIAILIDEGDIDFPARIAIEQHGEVLPIAFEAVLLRARRQHLIHDHAAFLRHALYEALRQHVELLPFLPDDDFQTVSLSRAEALGLEREIALFVGDAELRGHHPVVALAGRRIHGVGDGTGVREVIVGGIPPCSIGSIEAPRFHLGSRRQAVSIEEHHVAHALGKVLHVDTTVVGDDGLLVAALISHLCGSSLDVAAEVGGAALRQHDAIAVATIETETTGGIGHQLMRRRGSDACQELQRGGRLGLVVAVEVGHGIFRHPDIAGEGEDHGARGHIHVSERAAISGRNGRGHDVVSAKPRVLEGDGMVLLRGIARQRDGAGRDFERIVAVFFERIGAEANVHRLRIGGIDLETDGGLYDLPIGIAKHDVGGLARDGDIAREAELHVCHLPHFCAGTHGGGIVFEQIDAAAHLREGLGEAEQIVVFLNIGVGGEGLTVG